MYTLHKLPEGFIVTSNEDIKEGDEVIHIGNPSFTFNESMRNFLCKDCKKVIAQQDQIDFSDDISEEKLKEIGWFDLEKLSYEEYPQTKHDNMYDEGLRIGFETGFQKAQQLLSDKKFTLEDMRKMMETGIVYGRQFEWDVLNGNKRKEEHNQLFDKLIQSLSQKSWNINGKWNNDVFIITNII